MWLMIKQRFRNSVFEQIMTCKVAMMGVWGIKGSENFIAAGMSQYCLRTGGVKQGVGNQVCATAATF